MGIFRDTHFAVRKLQTHKAGSLVYKKLTRNCVEQWSGRVSYTELLYIVFSDVKRENFAKMNGKTQDS